MRNASALIGTLFLLGSVRAEQNLPAAPMLPHDIPCDAKAGKVLHVSFNVPGKAFTVTGQIRMVAPRADAKYVPSATVLLIGKGDVGQIGLKAFIDPREPDQMQLVIVGPKESAKIASWPWRDAPAKFIVASTLEGELKVDAGGAVATTALDSFEAESIYLACSTGKFEFKGVSAQAW